MMRGVLAGIRLRSSLPGRQRWDVPPLRREPLLARQVELEMRGVEGLTEVNANPLTGRVLVAFDEGAATDVARILAAVFERLAERVEPRPRPQPAGDRAAPQGLRSLLRLADVPRPDGSLLALIRSVETSAQPRWRASRRTLLNTVASLTPPITLGLIMAAAVSGGFPFLAHLGLSALGQIALLTAAYMGGNTLNTLTEYRSKRAWQAYATGIEHSLRVKAFSHVEHLDMAYLENQSTSQVLSVIHDDAVRIRDFLSRVPDSMIDRVATFAAGGVFLLWISPISFALALVPLPVILALYRRYHKRIADQYGVQGKREQAARKLLSNSLSGLPTIRAFSMEGYELERLEEASEDVLEGTRDAYTQAIRYADLTKFAMVAGIGLPIVYGGALLARGKITVTVFMLQSFMMPKMIGTMGGLDNDYDRYQGASAAARRLAAILDVRPTVLDGGERLGAVAGDLRFENVSFAYSSSERVFAGFDLHVEAGRSIAVVGPTGSGKSTLTKLLLRFYDPAGGRILLDGRDVRSLALRDLRQAVGLVSQDVFLFHGTVAENILYGRPAASRAEVVAAARVAGALEFIEQLPEGFETIVGERGQKLSGGQRQRISIARVVLKDPPIVILDEATSAVDNETEAAIQRSLTEIARGKTMIWIAHRLSTIRNVDRIYVLDRGAVVEQGSHDELLQMRGTYAALWQLQTGAAAAGHHRPVPDDGRLLRFESKKEPT